MTLGAHPSGSSRARIVAWVATSILPHEPAVRAWLRTRTRSQDDIDDLVQEAYAKLAALSAVDHIASPRSYFFQTVRNLLTDHIRRERIVSIEAVSDLDQINARDEAPSPEELVANHREFARLLTLIAELPDRCGLILRMRRIDGLSQREIATRLGLSESVVENDAVKGLRLLMQAFRDAESQDLPKKNMR